MQLRLLGAVDYLPTYRAMQAFTEGRSPDTADELWLCEHPAVFTQGIAGKAEHVLAPGNTPVVATNRGGQVTYHGPGQVVAYPLVDLRRRGYFVKEYVYRLEEAVIRTLREFGVTGHRVRSAPGIYVRLEDPFGHGRLAVKAAASSTAGAPPPQPFPGGGGSFRFPPPPGEGQGGGARADPFAGLGKIAALGVKVSRHCTYHGVALNVAMDLEPFSRIHPCGYAGLETVDLSRIGVPVHWNEVAPVLGHKLIDLLSP